MQHHSLMLRVIHSPHSTTWHNRVCSSSKRLGTFSQDLSSLFQQVLSVMNNDILLLLVMAFYPLFFFF